MPKKALIDLEEEHSVVLCGGSELGCEVALKRPLGYVE